MRGDTPRRIQLSRRKGWRKPENTVVVARPSKWGNPFSIAEHGRAHAIAAFRAMLDDPAARAALDYPGPDEIRERLVGKNLACWCPLDQLCHADVLLEIANRGTDEG
ncbi:DUF4326 domain-containing protein [Leifsonia sp. F6_8S_P_1B]|uniref:DUF4326 domain-containing protein n=1 Tax=Leifsonia williamsii TaxID=3035919 RepID=A0ABT8KFS3_9MICO|nr:DUF4326 domain-containing protein [Leifsonia williamsii]MDN4616309.1 DUF4326 domain-containing protein [Leifsonia williamsii]